MLSESYSHHVQSRRPEPAPAEHTCWGPVQDSIHGLGHHRRCRQFVAPAHRRIASRENTTLCLHSNLLFGSEIVIVNKFCVSKPGSICHRRFALLTIRPVAIKSTGVIATSEATRMATRRCRPRPAVELC